MTEQHPITPPPELIEEWCEQLFGCPDKPEIAAYELAHLAAQWAADLELDACCSYLYERLKVTTIACIAQELRAARRPKTPSLKEQALKQLASIQIDLDRHCMGASTNTIRRALEQLDD